MHIQYTIVDSSNQRARPAARRRDLARRVRRGDGIVRRRADARAVARVSGGDDCRGKVGDQPLDEQVGLIVMRDRAFRSFGAFEGSRQLAYGHAAFASVPPGPPSVLGPVDLSVSPDGAAVIAIDRGFGSFTMWMPSRETWAGASSCALPANRRRCRVRAHRGAHAGRRSRCRTAGLRSADRPGPSGERGHRVGQQRGGVAGWPQLHRLGRGALVCGLCHRRVEPSTPSMPFP